jgi:pimeloyl-ACP methyl ester carboxylesterase
VLAQVSRRKIRLPESGIEIALLDWGGDGPIALLHHANGYCAAIWAPVAERLRCHYRVIEVDSGHLVPMERPDCVAEAVIDFATQER